MNNSARLFSYLLSVPLGVSAFLSSFPVSLFQAGRACVLCLGRKDISSCSTVLTLTLHGPGKARGAKHRGEVRRCLGGSLGFALQ